MDLDGVDPVELAVALSQLPQTHPALAAARSAVDVNDARDTQRRDDLAASKDLSRAWADGRQADRVIANERVWRARADVDASGRAVDEARAVVARIDEPMPPLPRNPGGSERTAATAAALQMAVAWRAEQAAHEADLERSAQEARWAAEDHADEVAELEAAHPGLSG